jgi:uncharacterized phage protein gp47/JayE
MAAISWQGLTGYVRTFVTAVQAAANDAVDSSDGSITLALGQAVTGAALWLQAQIAQVLGLTRASTSFGSDLDSWMADFFFDRLPGKETTGLETFSRFTATKQAVVPVGSLVSTGPGGGQYIVTTDPTNPAYNVTLNGYVAAANVASVTVPISATVAGLAGNVLANTITSFVQPIPGFDTCTNAADLTNGFDAETDPSFLARFQDYIQSLRKGTVLAIRFAILSLQQGLTCVILENVATDGSTDNGFLTIVVDDGTGAPPDSLLEAASDAIDLDVRAAGIRYAIIGPTVDSVVISLTVGSIDSTLHTADTEAAQAAILTYVNALQAGATLVWSRLYQLAFDASENINSVSAILINSGTSDIVPTATQVIKTTSVTVA